MRLRSQRQPAAVRPGVVGGVAIARATRDAGSPTQPELPDGSVSSPVNESETFSEWGFAQQVRASCEILARSPVWAPHQPREERSSYPEDWFLVSS